MNPTPTSTPAVIFPTSIPTLDPRALGVLGVPIAAVGLLLARRAGS